MELVKITEAVGHVLCHDMTQIIRGEKKGPVFRKGHVLRAEDIPVLLSIGKEHLYVWEKKAGMIHEDEAAEMLYHLCKGDNMNASEIKEGKIELLAASDGVLKINLDKMNQINALGDIMIASRHGNFPVKAGDTIAGTRVIPLVIEEQKMNQAKAICEGEPIFEIRQYVHKKVGIVTTGSEVYHGRIKDTFTPVIAEKLAEFDAEIIGHVISDDQHEMITQSIISLIDQGADMIICTGGMSVDPDDRTPLAIKNTGARMITYGAPVLPGAMFLLAYYDKTIPIMGLPGCVMYARRTIFDLVLSRIMTDEKLHICDFTTMGQGGLCLSCDICTFPNCGFGK
ncbi:putative molybdopterin binding domain protein [anaerobic digester metagenome]